MICIEAPLVVRVIARSQSPSLLLLLGPRTEKIHHRRPNLMHSSFDMSSVQHACSQKRQKKHQSATGPAIYTNMIFTRISDSIPPPSCGKFLPLSNHGRKVLAGNNCFVFTPLVAWNHYLRLREAGARYD